MGVRTSLLAALGCVSVLASAPVYGQSLEPCDWVASAANLVSPWEENSRTYANGAIRIALLDTGGEPVCCSRHLLILSPDPEYGQACNVLSFGQGMGYYEIFLPKVRSSYDPARGLSLVVPVGQFDPDTGRVDLGRLSAVVVTINQATGQVTVE
ncbi:hypothetical protein [Phycobacter azelaicus]|jgi:hypothetical protein|uniref:hypothetical protein n=1 Tax=Phycobacter azelaicus TaxID=2668075 RepID=UPI001865E78C|nr:hypothetical protein [Phycobacter azelaicus]MBE1295176.1 hypothetical protein [Paracoccaceae bacterium]